MCGSSIEAEGMTFREKEKQQQHTHFHISQNSAKECVVKGNPEGVDQEKKEFRLEAKDWRMLSMRE